jgi:hypothetical protein
LNPLTNHESGPARLGIAALCLLVALLMCIVAVPSAGAVQTPFESNDTLATAFGPLAVNQTYTAATETTNDKDYYYFYVTSPSSSQVQLTLRDLGGGPLSDGGTSLSLQDAHGATVATTISATRNGSNFNNLAITLPAGKYYIFVQPTAVGYGDTYSIATGGTDGAFDAYTAIAAQCATATNSVNVAQGKLSKATLELKKAKARVTRSQHKPKAARRAAARAESRARQAVAAANDALKAATDGQRPWCFIPQ